MLVDKSFDKDIVKVSVADTAAVIPELPVTVIVLPATTDCVFDPSDNTKPVADTEVLISLIAATNEPLAVVANDDRSPVSVA
jgi:hypothetical protein